MSSSIACTIQGERVTKMMKKCEHHQILNKRNKYLDMSHTCDAYTQVYYHYCPCEI